MVAFSVYLSGLTWIGFDFGGDLDVPGSLVAGERTTGSAGPCLGKGGAQNIQTPEKMESLFLYRCSLGVPQKGLSQPKYCVLRAMMAAKEKEFKVVHHREVGESSVHGTKKNIKTYRSFTAASDVVNRYSPGFPQKGLSRPKYCVLRAVMAAKEKEFMVLPHREVGESIHHAKRSIQRYKYVTAVIIECTHIHGIPWYGIICHSIFYPLAWNVPCTLAK